MGDNVPEFLVCGELNQHADSIFVDIIKFLFCDMNKVNKGFQILATIESLKIGKCRIEQSNKEMHLSRSRLPLYLLQLYDQLITTHLLVWC